VSTPAHSLLISGFGVRVPDGAPLSQALDQALRAREVHAPRHRHGLLAGGVDIRTVAGRLGHAGGGATTLKVYAAWVASADRSAAGLIAAGLTRPTRTAE